MCTMRPWWCDDFARGNIPQVWFGAMIAKAEAAGGGVPLTPLQRRNVRIENPVPRNIGCPYGGGEGYPDCTYW